MYNYPGIFFIDRQILPSVLEWSQHYRNLYQNYKSEPQCKYQKMEAELFDYETIIQMQNPTKALYFSKYRPFGYLVLCIVVVFNTDDSVEVYFHAPYGFDCSLLNRLRYNQNFDDFTKLTFFLEEKYQKKFNVYI